MQLFNFTTRLCNCLVNIHLAVQNFRASFYSGAVERNLPGQREVVGANRKAALPPSQYQPIVSILDVSFLLDGRSDSFYDALVVGLGFGADDPDWEVGQILLCESGFLLEVVRCDEAAGHPTLNEFENLRRLNGVEYERVFELEGFTRLNEAREPAVPACYKYLPGLDL